MKSRRRNDSYDRPTKSQRSNCLRNQGDYLQTIPIDLSIDILSRLPAKAIARCRCVSKPWASMLRLPEFTELFLTRSWTRPQLLLACKKHGELYFFSSPQSQNPNEKSSRVTSNYHMKFPFDSFSDFRGCVRGLVCLALVPPLKGGVPRIGTVPVICNPSTGLLIKLPVPTVKAKKPIVYSYFGYDPVEKQFKVLLAIIETDKNCKERQILTIGAKNSSWRTVECDITHNPICSGISINGVLYYVAAVYMSAWAPMIVSFDVRSEKFRFIAKDEEMDYKFCSVLVNYKGKLGVLLANAFGKVTGETVSFELWILEDPEKHVWSKHVYEMPSMWENVDADDEFYFVGLTGTNEIVLSPRFVSYPLYVYYYNIENKTMRRFEIRGMGGFKDHRVDAFVNHVEDVKLLEML